MCAGVPILTIEIVVCLCAAFTTYGQHTPPFYAVYSDGNISSVSFSSNNVDEIKPNEPVKILLSCNNPLQCIPPHQNGTSFIYFPNENNSGLILLEIEGETLHTYNITSPCVFNDFALIPNHDRPLLITCRLIEDDDSMRFVLTNRYGTADNAIIPVPGGVSARAVVSPIILGMLGFDDDGIANIVSINTQNKTVTYEALQSDRDFITSNFPCIPAHLTRHRLNNIFLLTCKDDRSYLVNISSERPLNPVILPTSIAALATNARYSLAITLSGSIANISVQEVMSQPVPIRTAYMQFNTTVIYEADFGPDDQFVYIATDSGTVFINVGMALNGDEEFMHTVPSQLCSQCPPVVFLNNNTVLISSSISNQAVLLEIFRLSPWPPQQLSPNSTLDKQPKWYWFTPSVDFFPLIDSTPASNEELSDGDIAGIAIGCTLAFSLLVGFIMVVKFCYKRTCKTADTVLQEDKKGTENTSGNTEMMVTGGPTVSEIKPGKPEDKAGERITDQQLVNVVPQQARSEDTTRSFCESGQDESQGSSKIRTVENEENCPLRHCQSDLTMFGYNGGELSVKEHAVKVIIPVGAIDKRFKVEIRASASLFGPFIIPEDYYPISPYVWVGASYEFKEKLEVEIEHDIHVTEEKNLSELCVLTACEEDKCDGQYKMHKDNTCEYQYEFKKSTCTLHISQFSCKCLAVKGEPKNQKRIIMYHYLPKDYMSAYEFIAEVSFCYDLQFCRQRTEDRYAKQRMKQESSNLIYIYDWEKDKILLQYPNKLTGWKISHVGDDKIAADKLNFRSGCEHNDDFKDDRFLPRFRLKLVNTSRDYNLSSTYKYKIRIQSKNRIVEELELSISEFGCWSPNKVPPEPTSSPPDLSQPPPSQTVPSAGTSPGIMNKKPEMADLQRYVIPKIMNHWEQIAEALRYEDSFIESIKQKELGDPKKCCREFLRDWLNSNRGTGPKVWSTLINILEDPDLKLIEASTMEEMIARIKQLK